ncbi:MAG: hypothetical protein IV298_16110 [Cylindrospermopsis raciborskii KL1]|jgi:hypothetical protein|nr:hypothetical protein [Cylindrospermopsis raciborskii]MBG0744953.1 hypothetical protein [Cylindrospermopsis raciborskii KL1]
MQTTLFTHPKNPDIVWKIMTLPKLHFPEFQDAGEWNNELLKELYSLKKD